MVMGHPEHGTLVSVILIAYIHAGQVGGHRDTVVAAGMIQWAKSRNMSNRHIKLPAQKKS